MADVFWTRVREQLQELESAKTADDVVRILAHDRNPYLLIQPGREPGGAGDGFFGGSGGEDTVMESLREAGWTFLWRRAPYWWAMQAPDLSIITYIEGDIYKGDRRG